MKKYVVAIFSHMDGDNRIFITTCTSSIDALKNALIEHCPKKWRNEDYRKWVEGMPNTEDGIFTAAAQSELVLSKPIII